MLAFLYSKEHKYQVLCPDDKSKHELLQIAILSSFYSVHQISAGETIFSVPLKDKSEVGMINAAKETSKKTKIFRR